MKKSYLTLKRILLSAANMYLEKGDILVYDALAKQNNLTIYRSGALIKSVPHSHLGISALVHAGTIEELNGLKDGAAAAIPAPTKKVATGMPSLPVITSKSQKSLRPKPALPEPELEPTKAESAVSEEVSSVPEVENSELASYRTKHQFA